MPYPPTQDLPEPVVLILADISGYTKFMTANAKSLVHSQVIIGELLQTLLRAVELPMTVSKIEGDAVFLYARKNDPLNPWEQARIRIRERLPLFIQAFQCRVHELSGSTTCTCGACANLDQLRLKFIVHSGVALFHRIAGFLELAGPDVILAHRLLKNSSPSRQYILLTDSALTDLGNPDCVRHQVAIERYDGFPDVTTHVFTDDSPPAPGDHRDSLPGAIGWNLRLWFESLVSLLKGARPAGRESEAAVAQGRILGVLGLVLTPFYVPVSIVTTVLARLAQRGRQPVATADTNPL